MRISQMVIVVTLALLVIGCDSASATSQSGIDTTPLTSAEMAEMQGQLDQAANEEQAQQRPDTGKGGKSKKRAPRTQMEMESQQ